MALTVPLIPSAPQAAREVLLATPEVTTLVATRIGTEIHKTRPCIRFRQITSSEAAARWLHGTLIQFDALAEETGKARQISATVYAALRDFQGRTAYGVVTGVTLERGPEQTADPVLVTSSEDPLPMWSMDLRVFVHP